MISIPIPFSISYPHSLDIPYTHVCSWRWFLYIDSHRIGLMQSYQSLHDTLQNKWSYEYGIAYHGLACGQLEKGKWTLGEWKVEVDSFWHDGPHTIIQLGWMSYVTTAYWLYAWLEKRAVAKEKL